MQIKLLKAAAIYFILNSSIHLLLSFYRLQYNTVFIGEVYSGLIVKIFYYLFYLVQLIGGVGILMKKKSAYYVMVSYYLVFIVVNILNIAFIKTSISQFNYYTSIDIVTSLIIVGMLLLSRKAITQ